MKSPLRILLLSHVPDNRNGGASRIYHMLASRLRQRGHHVELRHQEDMGLPASQLGRKLAVRFALPRFVSRHGESSSPHDFDIIMSSNGMGAPLYRRLRRNRRRPALVNHLHGVGAYNYLANMAEHELGHWRASLAYRVVTGPFQVRWDNEGARAADMTIAQNLRDLSWARPLLPPGGDAICIPAAVYPDVAAAIDATPARESEPGRILWFGTWEARKGAAYVPGAFRLIRQRQPAARLALAGAGRPKNELLACFEPEDRNSVDDLGFLDATRQVEELRRASVFLFPSLSEGYGLALLEALRAGVAAVTTSTGFGGDHLTDGESARIVFPSTEHIARAVCDILGNDELRGRLERNGQALARRFTLDRMGEAYEEAFLGLRHSDSARGRTVPVSVTTEEIA